MGQVPHIKSKTTSEFKHDKQAQQTAVQADCRNGDYPRAGTIHPGEKKISAPQVTAALFETVFAFYLIAGNSYIEAAGPKNSEPLEGGDVINAPL